MLILNYRQCVQISQRTYPLTLSNEPILQLGSAEAFFLGIVAECQYRTLESGDSFPILAICNKVFVKNQDS